RCSDLQIAELAAMSGSQFHPRNVDAKQTHSHPSHPRNAATSQTHSHPWSAATSQTDSHPWSAATSQTDSHPWSAATSQTHSHPSHPRNATRSHPWSAVEGAFGIQSGTGAMQATEFLLTTVQAVEAVNMYTTRLPALIK
uniref:Uncharacterized protein n=1 Tax=Gadus morhua TaxID=8049 RepID=A0A8C5C4X4_GADMO